MQVETFECQETAAEPIEAGEEALGLIESMHLAGQQSLLSRNTETGRGQRCPYRHIRKDERFVYGTLCPAKSKLENYAEAPIPLRVLQIAAHAQSLNLFQVFMVWSAEGAVKDPVLLAYEVDQYHGTPFILARWGEELDEWPSLCKKALAKWKDAAKGALGTALAKVKLDIASIEDATFDFAAEKSIPLYYGF